MVERVLLSDRVFGLVPSSGLGTLARIRACMHVSGMCVHTCLHNCAPAHVCLRVHVRARARTHRSISRCMRACLATRTYTHVRTCAGMHVSEVAHRAERRDEDDCRLAGYNACDYLDHKQAGYNPVII